MSESAIVLDSNLLVLYIVGTASRAYIDRHRRLQAYTESDYELLLGLIEAARTVLTTPNALSEASNLAGYIASPARDHVFEVMRAMTRGLEEVYVPSSVAVERAEFVRLGLTDATMLDLASSERVLLTADFDLYQAALAKGAAAVNFNHLRG